MIEKYKQSFFISCILYFNILSAFTQVRQITIDDSKTFQKIESFTASDAWSGNFVGRFWKEKQKGQVAEWLFSQEYDLAGNPSGIGLSMWRVNLGAGTLEQDSADIEPFHRRTESFLSKDGLYYDWNKCIGQQYFMEKAADYGCNNFLLFSNSPPVQYTKNGKGWSNLDDQVNLKPDYFGKFASYMVEVARFFTNEKGWHIAYISPINEPQVNWTSPRQEGSPWKSSEMKKMYVELDKALSGSQLSDTKILVGETGDLKHLYENSESLRERFPNDDAPDNQINAFFNPRSPNYIGNLKHIPPLIAGHSYGSNKTNVQMKETREKTQIETEKYGVKFHQSEWCMLPGLKLPIDGMTSDWEPVNYAGIEPSLMLGRLIYSDIVYAGAESWGYWKGMEISGNHALISLYPKDGDLLKGGVVRSNKMLWALGNYSFFIRPEYQRIELKGADDLNTLVASSYISPDKTHIVAVYVNSSFSKIPINVAFVNGKNKKIKVYITDERTDLNNMNVPEKFSSTTEYIIPPRAIVTMVFDNEK